MDLVNKVVFISGASSGIGAMAALRFAERGARVAIGARSMGKLNDLAREITQKGGTAFPVELDVTDQTSAKKAVSSVLDRFGAIDVLINNAGNGGTLGLFMDSDPESSRAMFNVHVFGAELMTRAVLPSMLQRKSGRVVMVASTVAYVPMPGAIAYCAAKAAVLAMAECLRGELSGSGVEIACFSPPHTQTEAGKAWPLDLPKEFSPLFAAREMVKSIEKDRFDYLSGGNGSLLALKRVSPKLVRKIMNGIGLSALRKVKAAKLGYSE